MKSEIDDIMGSDTCQCGEPIWGTGSLCEDCQDDVMDSREDYSDSDFDSDIESDFDDEMDF